MHSWREPFDRIVALANAQGIPVMTPMMGEAVSLHDAKGSRRWWDEPDRVEETVQVKGDPAAEPL